MGLIGSSKDTPDTDGDYGVKVFSSPNDAEVVIPIGTDTNSWLIRAPPGNGGPVYIGWDDQVTTSNGMPLTAGDSLSVDIDNDEQVVWAVADTGGDELRYFTTR